MTDAEEKEKATATAMKTTISTPSLWMEEVSNLLPDYVIGGLHRRGVDAKPGSVELREVSGVSMMSVDSREGLSEQEYLSLQECLSRINEVLVKSNPDSFSDDLRKWSYKETSAAKGA